MVFNHSVNSILKGARKVQKQLEAARKHHQKKQVEHTVAAHKAEALAKSHENEAFRASRLADKWEELTR